ncbi:hypothetical protein ACCO45_008700 [Purpureocillium lilacinum]|uniref:Uncharacterized protein n=1 Tax=Purpureocillium lilacinum TaxID=33203 RepID=A0ACC4DPU7_PURLI
MLDLNSYSRLSTSDPSNSLVSSADEDVQDCPVAGDKALASEPRRWIPLALGIVNLCCVGIILGLFIRLGQSPVQAVPNVKWEYTSNKNHLLKQTSYYCMHQNISSKKPRFTSTDYVTAPYLDRVELPLKDVQVDGSFVGRTFPISIFKQGPSAEVDAAWDRLYKFHYLLLSKEEVKKLGKNPKYTVKAPRSWGYGDEVYVSRTDVAHRIHCLNMLRKATYPEEIYSRLRDGDEATRVLWRPHVMHCAHILLQHLMCSATLEAVTYNWVEGMQYPQADFSVNRRCTDMEAILEWQKEDGVVDVTNHPWMIQDWLDSVPEDAPRLPIPVPYQNLFNATSHGLF